MHLGTQEISLPHLPGKLVRGFLRFMGIIFCVVDERRRDDSLPPSSFTTGYFWIARK